MGITMDNGFFVSNTIVTLIVNPIVIPILHLCELENCHFFFGKPSINGP